jgi:GNAT superfamily N-acetyltransferase
MSNIDCVIRTAAKHEIPEIEALIVAHYDQYRRAIAPAIFDAYIAELSDIAGNLNDAQALVAELNGRIAGSALFYPDASDEGWGLPKGWAGFRKLAVHPNRRGYGLGRKIAEQCVDLGKRIGAPTVAIHTASFMSAARDLYERIGFQRCPEYDVRASDLLGIKAGPGDVKLIAYRLDLVSPRPRARHDLDRDVQQDQVMQLQGDRVDPVPQGNARSRIQDSGIDSDDGLEAALRRELINIACSIGIRVL